MCSSSVQAKPPTKRVAGGGGKVAGACMLQEGSSQEGVFAIRSHGIAGQK